MSSKLLFIFEMANNHMGDPAHGIRIIRELREACKGFEFRLAVKLQYRNLPELIHPDYRARTDLKFVKRFTETALSWEDCRRLKDAIVENGFLSICTPFDEVSVDKVVEHGFDYLKVASQPHGLALGREDSHDPTPAHPVHRRCTPGGCGPNREFSSAPR